METMKDAKFRNTYILSAEEAATLVDQLAGF
jgi:hypothetical protein